MNVDFKNTDGETMAAQSGGRQQDVRFIRLGEDGRAETMFIVTNKEARNLVERLHTEFQDSPRAVRQGAPTS